MVRGLRGSRASPGRDGLARGVGRGGAAAERAHSLQRTPVRGRTRWLATPRQSAETFSGPLDSLGSGPVTALAFQRLS
jgi:hypothetical protein